MLKKKVQKKMCNKQITITDMVDTNSAISIIALNASDLNTLIKRQIIRVD